MMESSLKIKIGGEFDINPSDFLGYSEFVPNDDTFLYSSGRSALMAILCYIIKQKPSEIHIPYYICSSVVKACENVRFHVNFYELNNKFLFPIEYLDHINYGETILSVNYFGFTDDNSLIKEIKHFRPDITIISDHVQSMWTYKDSEADFSFTSFRKHLPTPDGAPVFIKNSNCKIVQAITENSFYNMKFIGALLKHCRINDKIYLKYFEEGENELNFSDRITKASPLGNFFYEKANLEYIKQKRKENYKILYELGNDNGFKFLFPYNEKIIPLVVPIMIKNRNEIRKNLMALNIFLPLHWPIEKYCRSSIPSMNIYEQVLSLIIDQRYNTEDMEYQIKMLIKNS